MNEPDRPKNYVIELVRDSIANDPRINELDIKVAVKGNKVFVSGSVPTAERREAVTIVVEEAIPDYEVHNEIAVRTFREPGEPEELV